MSPPPAHLSSRTLAPGALLALLVTSAALFALAVVVALGPDGPARLWLDGGGSATILPRADAGPAPGTGAAGDPVSLLPGSASSLDGEVRLGSPVAAADRPGAVQLRSTTRVRRRAPARRPAAGSPSRPAPVATPSPSDSLSQTTAAAPAPVAPPAPGSTVVKSRGRGTGPAPADVPKQRVSRPAPAPAPDSPPPSYTPGPAPRAANPPPAPAPVLRPYRPAAQPDAGVGAADGTLHRVPPTQP